MPCKQFPRKTLAARQSVLRLLCPFSIILPNTRVRQVDTEPCYQPRTTGSCVLLQAARALLPWSRVCSMTATQLSQRQPACFPHGMKHLMCTVRLGRTNPGLPAGASYTQMNLSRCSQGTQQSTLMKEDTKAQAVFTLASGPSIIRTET